MESVKEDNKKEEKYYVNLIFCKLSIGVIFTFVYIFANISLTLINRLIFQKFNFKFNFTLLFLQQLFCCIFFTFLGNTNETFRSKSGEISFKDFNKLKYQYVIFCFIIKFIYWKSISIKYSNVFNFKKICSSNELYI